MLKLYTSVDGLDKSIDTLFMPMLMIWFSNLLIDIPIRRNRQATEHSRTTYALFLIILCFGTTKNMSNSFQIIKQIVYFCTNTYLLKLAVYVYEIMYHDNRKVYFSFQSPFPAICSILKKVNILFRKWIPYHKLKIITKHVLMTSEKAFFHFY